MITELIPDKTKRDRVVEAVTGTYKRPENITVDGAEVPNPTSKEDFTDNILKSFLKEITIAFEANKAAEAARVAAVNKAKDEVII